MRMMVVGMDRVVEEDVGLLSFLGGERQESGWSIHRGGYGRVKCLCPLTSRGPGRGRGVRQAVELQAVAGAAVLELVACAHHVAVGRWGLNAAGVEAVATVACQVGQFCLLFQGLRYSGDYNSHSRPYSVPKYVNPLQKVAHDSSVIESSA